MRYFSNRRLLEVFSIFILSVLVRWFAIKFYPAPVESDCIQYFQEGKDLWLSHHFVNELGQATAFRPPGYAFFLATSFALFGINEMPVYVLQVLIGALVCVLMTFTAHRFLTWKQSLLAGSICAIYPSFFWLSRILLSENLAIPFALLAIYLTLLCYQKPNHRNAFLLGIGLGIGNLIRGGYLLSSLMFMAVLGFLFFKRERKFFLTASLLAPAVLSMGLINGAWAYRNHLKLGKWILVSTNNGVMAYESYWPPVVNSKRIWGNVNKPAELGGPDQPSGLSEVAESQALMDYTIAHLQLEPSRLVRFIPEKLFYLLIPIDYTVFPHFSNSPRSMNWGYLLLLFPALWGWMILWREQTDIALILSVIPFSVFLQTLIFLGDPRYRSPAEIILLMSAPLALTAWQRNIFRKRDH